MTNQRDQHRLGVDLVPPHSEPAEQAVLGGVLWDNDAIHEVRGILDPEAFYFGRHRLIYETMLELTGAGKPVDSIMLREALEAQGLLEKAGGGGYFEELLQHAMTSANIVWHAGVVKEKAMLRQLIELGQSLVSSGMQDIDSPETIIGSIGGHLQSMQAGQSGGAVTIASQIKRAIEKPKAAIFTGFHELDSECPVCEGDLNLIAAPTSQGKTAFTSQMAWQAFRRVVEAAEDGSEVERPQPAGVLIFSSENPAWKAARRMLVHIEQRGYYRVTGNIPGNWVRRLDQIWIDDQTMDVDEICARTTAMHAQGRVHAVIIDLFKHCTTRERTQSENARYSIMLRAMKRLARLLPVFLVHQFNRTGQPFTPPELSWLRDSGSFEQDCQNIWFLYAPERPGNPREPYAVNLLVAKQSTGPRDMEIRFMFDPRTLTFSQPAVKAGSEQQEMSYV